MKRLSSLKAIELESILNTGKMEQVQGVIRTWPTLPEFWSIIIRRTTFLSYTKFADLQIVRLQNYGRAGQESTAKWRSSGVRSGCLSGFFGDLRYNTPILLLKNKSCSLKLPMLLFNFLIFVFSFGSSPAFKSAVPSPSEFISYLLDKAKMLSSSYYLDAHFKPLWASSPVCAIDFDVIGRIETFDQDATFIINSLQLKVRETSRTTLLQILSLKIR